MACLVVVLDKIYLVSGLSLNVDLISECYLSAYTSVL